MHASDPDDASPDKGDEYDGLSLCDYCLLHGKEMELLDKISTDF